MPPTLNIPDRAAAAGRVPLPTAAALGELGDFNLRKVGAKFLLTNDWGHHVLLDPRELRDFVKGRLRPRSPLWRELRAKGFLRRHLDRADLAARFAGLHSHLWRGPTLHIMVVTLRCNLKCVYCHSSVVGHGRPDFDMSVDTARRAVDLVFEGPSPSFTIEFQGGEPLLNWEAVRFIAGYAAEKARRENRGLRLVLVSNLTLLDDGKLEFLKSHRVSICTSLDGPPAVHDRNRIHLGGDSHRSAAAWIRRLLDEKLAINALMTTTRLSLRHPREIVEAYRRLGLREIFLRPLHYLGFAKRSWDSIGYTDEEFIRFYRASLDHILEINRGGGSFRESTAAMLLCKILKREDPGYMDLRSPCGAALGQVSYNHNGDVYTCDEGRMVGAENDHLFRIGNVRTSRFNDLVDHPSAKACCVASAMESQPLCASCAYKPFCGICPVLNHATQNTIWGRMPANSYCHDFMHILDYLFERLQHPEDGRILRSWVNAAEPAASPRCAGQV